MITLYFILAFALFDYFGYNLFTKWGLCNEKLINPYRVLQVIIQLAISYYLYNYVVEKNIIEKNLHRNIFIYVIAFNTLWIFGVADLLYYIYDFIIYKIFGKSFENNSFWVNKYEEMSWLFFTPLGIFKVKINKRIFIIQSLIGIAITILINIV